MTKYAKTLAGVFCAVLLTSTSSVFSQDIVEWVNKSTDATIWAADKEKLQNFGESFDNSWDMFEALRTAANGGAPIGFEDLSKPEYDWSGVFTRTGGGLSFDPDIKASETTAKLTEAGAATRQAKIDSIALINGEYDPISDCRAPGVPRWHTEPFLHEFIVTPQQTLLINEMVNDIRRVYTDGRDHTTEEDAYPTWNGDTIGFWNDGELVMHTKYLMSGVYQRGPQPDYSDQVTLVERWRKVDDVTLQADTWVFDPVNLAEPWFTRQSWTELANDDHFLRLRYWDCRENSNNDITKTEDGNSTFTAFEFMNNDKK